MEPTMKFNILIGLLCLVLFGVDNLKTEYIFEDYEYDLEELIEINKLKECKQNFGYRFNSNLEIKELADCLDNVEDVQKYILCFPYDNERVGSEFWKNATDILERGKGICTDKAILACSIFEEKNISCYIIGSNEEHHHAISLIDYEGSWRPILTTGVINKNNIDEFMETLYFVKSKDSYFNSDWNKP
jgi:hypothetical protein